MTSINFPGMWGINCNLVLKMDVMNRQSKFASIKAKLNLALWIKIVEPIGAIHITNMSFKMRKT